MTGQVRGRHHRDWISRVRGLVRAERYDDALVLARACLAAAQAEDAALGRPPEAFWVIQLGIILRRTGDHDGELELLEQYLAAVRAHPHEDDPELADRVRSRIEDVQRLRQGGAD